MPNFILSTPLLDLELKVEDHKFSLERFGLHDSAWTISLH